MTFEVFQAHLYELRFWSRWQTGGVSWRSARMLAALLDAYGRRSRAQYDTLLSASDRFFAPLSDPLRCDLGLHDWLALEREESYSKWLHWTLKQFAECGMLGEILDLPVLSTADVSRVWLSREWTIRQGTKKKNPAESI